MPSHTGDIAWREIGLLTLVAIFLALIALYIPMFYSVMTLVLPLIVALLVRRHHLTIALLSLLAVWVVAFLTSGNFLAVFSLVTETGLIGIATGLLFKNHLSPGRSLKIIIALSVTITLLLFGLTYAVTDANPLALEKELIQEIYQANQWYTNTNTLSLEEQQQLDKYLQDFIGLMVALIPGSMVIWSIIKSFIVYLFANKMFYRLGYHDNQLPAFREWQYPWYVIWGIIVGLIFLLAGDEWNLVLLGNLGKNIIYVMSFLFVVLGISVFTYFIKKWKTHGILKAIVVFMACVYWPLGLGLVLMLGVLDPIINLRRIGVESGQGG